MSQQQAGSTLAGSLVALGLLCLIMPAIVLLSEAVRTAKQETLELSRFDRSVIRAEKILRRGLERIRIPPELATLPVEIRLWGLRIYYLNGTPDAFLDILIEREEPEGSTKLVVVSSNGEAPQTATFSAASLRVEFPWKDMPLVRLDIEGNGGTHASLVARMGGWPLR